jgi:hypothetical protein
MWPGPGVLLIFSVAMLCAEGVCAQPAENPTAGTPVQVPPTGDGWTTPADGHAHAASGTQCPERVNGFDHLQFLGPTGPALLGSCTYVDDTGNGDAGIRVRRYVSGAGESQEAIDNDRALMEPNERQGAPMFAVRMDPVTTRDGTMGGRLTITKTRNGFLIDCFAEGLSLEIASAKLALICGN